MAVAAAAAALLVSCAGAGSPSKNYFKGASVVVRGVPSMELEDAIWEVFKDAGFRLASGMGDVMVFEKEGTRHDEWMYGGFEGKVTTQRVTVTQEIGDRPDTIRLLCEGKIIRNLSRLGDDETGYLYAGGRMRYQKYLNKVKKRAERARSQG